MAESGQGKNATPNRDSHQPHIKPTHMAAAYFKGSGGSRALSMQVSALDDGLGEEKTRGKKRGKR